MGKSRETRLTREWGIKRRLTAPRSLVLGLELSKEDEQGDGSGL